MEMSIGYMREAAEYVASYGWAHAVRSERPESETTPLVETEIHDLRRPDGAHVRLEALTYEDGSERYYLTLLEFSGLRTLCYPLESWRHRNDQIEFKFYEDHRTGEGLSFTLALN